MPHDADLDREQLRIIAALEDGSAVGAGQAMRRIDTHMSHIFLGEGRAYKLKRALRHPFADMTSVEGRRAACEAELAVNAKLAPGLYEGVSPVVHDRQGAIRVGGDGAPIDWVVIMRRFPDGALLSEMAQANTLTREAVEEAVTAVADFHTAQPPITSAGHTADYRRILAGLRETEAQGAAALGVAPTSSRLFEALERSLTRLSPLIEARRERGHVRRGHGDLHLRNICRFEGRIMPFDALEFDPTLATADVIYDVAFLLMDLRAQGLDDLANSAMNAYWDTTGQDDEALALLPFFMALRGAVRMAVSVEAGDLVEAARYRALGCDLLEAPHPQLVAVGGLSGTGKSTLARAIGGALPGPCGARLLRTDSLRKAMAGKAQTERLAEPAYEPAARAEVYRVLTQRVRAALEAGASVIADATFREDPARAAIEGAAGHHDFLGLWLRAGTDTRVGRVARRQDDASDATATVALEQIEPSEVGWRIIDAARPAEVVAEEVRRLLETRRQPNSPQASKT